MTIGVSCSAACTVAVPDAVSATSADASTVSVSPSTSANRASPAPRADRVEQRVVEVRRARDDELRAGHVAPDQPRGRGEIGQDARDLVRPAAGQDRDGRRRRRQPERGEKRARAAPTASRRSISGWPTNSTGTPPVS